MTWSRLRDLKPVKRSGGDFATVAAAWENNGRVIALGKTRSARPMLRFGTLDTTERRLRSDKTRVEWQTRVQGRDNIVATFNEELPLQTPYDEILAVTNKQGMYDAAQLDKKADRGGHPKRPPW